MHRSLRSYNRWHHLDKVPIIIHKSFIYSFLIKGFTEMVSLNNHSVIGFEVNSTFVIPFHETLEMLEQCRLALIFCFEWMSK